MNLQKAGGIAALVDALAYIMGFVVMILVFLPANLEALNDADKLAFLLEKKVIYQAWILFIYVVFGIFLAVLAIALHERLKAAATSIMQIATAFGLIWVGLVIASGMIANVGLDTVATVYAENPEQAATMWKTIDVVHKGLGGGVEVVGGLWVLLISWAGIQSKGLPKGVNYIGFVIGAAGVLTLIPLLSDLGAVFGLGQIFWFIWLGVFLLKAE